VNSPDLVEIVKKTCRRRPGKLASSSHDRVLILKTLDKLPAGAKCEVKAMELEDRLNTVTAYMYKPPMTHG